MKMNKLILATIISLWSVLAIGATKASSMESVDVSGLTPEQKAMIFSKVTEMAQNSGKSITTVETVSQWAELGKNLGQATVSAAREIGVATNEFVQTPLGKIVTMVVLYKMVGRDLIRIIAGIVIFITGISLGIHFIRRKSFTDDFSYDYKPMLYGLWNKKVIVGGKLDDRLMELNLVIGLASFAVSTGLSLIIIFGGS